jgi:hypothetical protein
MYIFDMTSPGGISKTAGAAYHSQVVQTENHCLQPAVSGYRSRFYRKPFSQMYKFTVTAVTISTVPVIN